MPPNAAVEVLSPKPRKGSESPKAHKSSDNNASETASTSGYRVLVRVRPPSVREISQGAAVQVTGPARLHVQEPFREPSELHIEGILGPDAGQADAFEAVADVVDAVTKGCSGTILAYGQTGSGKTYMMTGPPNTSVTAGMPADSESQRGLIPRALQHLFNQLTEQPGGLTASRVRVSVMEIYNETVFDLLETAASRKGLEIREVDGAVTVPGLASIEVHCLEEALRLLERSILGRARADNGVNASSSRSHAIFQVAVEDQSAGHLEASGELKQRSRAARLSFVDLAGSERVQSFGPKLAETSHINRSLSTLAQCISALKDAKRKHVPYRSSKLTRLLQEALQSPLSTTVMCVCISPGHASINETMRSLQFADCARRVAIPRPTQATKDLDVAAEELRRITEELREELRIERRERARLEALLHGVAATPKIESLDLLQAFRKTKEGLDQIICTVNAFEHTAPALATAKQGLLELAGAVEVLQQDAAAAESSSGCTRYDDDSKPEADSPAPRVTMCTEVLALADWLQTDSSSTTDSESSPLSPSRRGGSWPRTLATTNTRKRSCKSENCGLVWCEELDRWVGSGQLRVEPGEVGGVLSDTLLPVMA